MTVRRYERLLTALLEALGKDAQRKRFKRLQPERLEAFLKEHLQSSTENPATWSRLYASSFGYCATEQLLSVDFSGLIPPVRRYRHASIPKGMADSDLERVLTSIPQDTPVGARDYAILVLLMAYGIRGVSAAQLLLDDIDWQHSRIRIRAQKGGKEVLLPLIGAVGEAIVRYLPHRYSKSPFREVFLSAQAPFRPLRSGAISMIVHRHFERCGFKLPKSGTANASSFLGHSCLGSRLRHQGHRRCLGAPISQHDLHLCQGRPQKHSAGGHAVANQKVTYGSTDFFAVSWLLDWRPF